MKCEYFFGWVKARRGIRYLGARITNVFRKPVLLHERQDLNSSILIVQQVLLEPYLQPTCREMFKGMFWLTHWEFQTMYSHHIHPPTRVSSQSYLPTLCLPNFMIPHSLIAMFIVYVRVWGLLLLCPNVMDSSTSFTPWWTVGVQTVSQNESWLFKSAFRRHLPQ